MAALAAATMQTGAAGPSPGAPDVEGPSDAASDSFGPAGRHLMLVCKTAAVMGALVFTALVAMSIVSITGRKLWSAPIPGDVELLQMCSAFAAATFFAYCHLNRGDVKVDFFTDHLPPRIVHGLDAIGSLLVGLFGALLAWRTGAGALMVGQAGETSMILSLPLWVGQALMVPGFVLLALAGWYMAGWHLRRAARGTP
jgi:TRAP-type C4-dicarboxylate transport system permease small subunit